MNTKDIFEHRANQLDSGLLLSLLENLSAEVQEAKKAEITVIQNRSFLKSRGAGRRHSEKIAALSVQHYGSGSLASLWVFQVARRAGLVPARSSDEAMREGTRAANLREFVIARFCSVLQSRGAGQREAELIAAGAYDHCGGDSSTASAYLDQRAAEFSLRARLRSFQLLKGSAIAPPPVVGDDRLSCSVWWLGQNLVPRSESLAMVQDWFLKGAKSKAQEWARANWAREAKDLAEHGDGCGDDVGAWQCHSQDCLSIFREVYLVELAKWQAKSSKRDFERAAVLVSKLSIVRHLSPLEREAFFESFPAGFMKARGAAKRRAIKEAIAFRYAARGRDGREVAAGWAINGSTGSSSFKDSDGSTVPLNSASGWDSTSGKRGFIQVRRALFVSRLRVIAKTKELAARMAGSGGRGVQAAADRWRMAAIVEGERMTDGERADWTEGENQAMSEKFRQKISRLKKEVGGVSVEAPARVAIDRPSHRDFFASANY